MADKEVPTELYYRFACSSFVVSGTRETSTNWDSGEVTVVPKADVSLAVEADARQPIIRLPKLPGTHDVSLKLTSDGRLASISGTTHGILATAIEASLA